MKQKIKVALTPEGMKQKKTKKPYEIVMADVVGGIALHNYESGWRLTHVQSGRRISSGWNNYAELLSARRLLLKLIPDWKASADEIRPFLQAEAAKYLSASAAVDLIIDHAVVKK